MKRTRLRPRSDKAIARDEARRACVAAVIARDKGCMFQRAVGAYSGYIRELELPPSWQWCDGPLDAHEPRERSHGADPTDPDQAVCLCRKHHDWVHAHPSTSYRLGLLVRGNGEPYRRRT